MPSECALPDAVVFDNDGLLLDTESVWTRAEQDLFERRGIEFTPQHKRELVGTSAEIAGGILERRLGEPGRAAELIEELNELVVAELEHGVEAMVGARELLHSAEAARHADRARLQLPARLRPALAGDRRLRRPLRRGAQRPRSRGARSRHPILIWRPAAAWASSRARRSSPSRTRQPGSPPPAPPA